MGTLRLILTIVFIIVSIALSAIRIVSRSNGLKDEEKQMSARSSFGLLEKKTLYYLN